MDYKEISKLFIEYDGDVQINPFAKMHWGILKTILIFLNYMPDNEMGDIKTDQEIMTELGKI